MILCTDGDLNVGVTSDEDLVELITQKAKGGTFLTVLGFGEGNLQDEKIEKLADNGNGVYASIDGVREARKVLVEQLTGSTITIAKDVKIQVEFNPAQVASYRLLGYENRLLAAEDFRDDKKDAGAGFDAASADLRFAAAVAAFGMILRDSEHKGTATLELVQEIAGTALGTDAGGYRAEFLDLVRKAEALGGPDRR